MVQGGKWGWSKEGVQVMQCLVSSVNSGGCVAFSSEAGKAGATTSPREAAVST